MAKPHRIVSILRDLRLEKFGSLAKFEDETGIKAVVEGSYERGDRHPTIERVDEILSHYGLELSVREKETD